MKASSIYDLYVNGLGNVKTFIVAKVVENTKIGVNPICDENTGHLQKGDRDCGYRNLEQQSAGGA